MNETVREISLVGKSFDYLHLELHENNPLFGVLSLEIKQILSEKEDIETQRQKLLDYLLGEIKIYKDEIAEQQLIPKIDYNSMLFFVKNIYKYQVVLGDEFINEVLSAIAQLYL